MNTPGAGGAWRWAGGDGGGFVPCAGLPLADRGFRYGMALFESLAVRGGRVEFLAAHLARLRAACGQLGWALDGAELEAAGHAVLATCGPGPVFVRLYLTAGDGGPAAPVEAPRLFLFAEPRGPAREQPCRLRTHPAPHLPFAGGLKTANYWAHAAAYAAALGAGADEALLFNPAGALVSAAMANVFVEIGGEWFTPPASTGARQGVVREWVMGRHPVAQRIIDAAGLEAATGCFLTSSWNGVVPVGSLNSRRIGTTVGERLRAQFFGHLRG